MFEYNRIEQAVATKKKQIAERIASGKVTKEKVEETRKALDMELDEYAKFQELKSLAVAHEKLTTEEGMTIYAYLGNTPEHFNNQPVEVKAVLSSLFKELLELRMQGKL